MNTRLLCTSVEWAYLPEAVADVVLRELVSLASAMGVGAPAEPGSDLGPLLD